MRTYIILKFTYIIILFLTVTYLAVKYDGYAILVGLFGVCIMPSINISGDKDE